ncbi:MAG: D-glycerate dehydrogenase [Armatimonadetes bacterium]|nr:D-glycerate dehydrogenase [Armatimonadota bacterium]
MKPFHTYVTREIPSVGLDLLLEAGSVETWQDDVPPPREELLSRVAEADALLCLLTDRIDAEVLDAAPKLKVVSAYAVGVDNIDVPAATERGICVCNTPGVLTNATADLTWALILAAARRIVEADACTRKGEWRSWGPRLMVGKPVAQSTLGIIGMGRIGQAVARRAMGFEMPILYHSGKQYPDIERLTGAKYVDLDTLLAESDFVTIHTQLTPETRGMIGANQLARMKPSAVLVNTARGPIVDQPALTEALREGRLYAAGLDVFEVEPVSQQDPLLELPNVVALPHIGSADETTRNAMARMAAEAILDVSAGRLPAHLVNYDVWDHRR